PLSLHDALPIFKLLRSLMLTRLEHFFDTHLFRTAARAMLFGTLLTFAVQSSSIPTSLAIPLAAAGVLKLSQLYPFSLGANLGTTLTAILAALATANPAAVAVAFAHLMFNGISILIICAVPFVSRMPVGVAVGMSSWPYCRLIVPVSFFLLFYFAILLSAVFLLHLTSRPCLPGRMSCRSSPRTTS